MSPLGLTGWGLAGILWLLTDALQAARRRRELQVARGCHELRGPLTAARLGLALERDTLPPATARRLRAIDAELARAAQTIEELGADGINRGGAADAHCRGARVVELGRLAEQVVEARAGRARAAGISLDGWLGEALVAGDERRLAQALANLIDNALVHGRGPVQVLVGARGGHARVEVSDHGPGLTEPLDAVIRRARHRGPRHGHGLTLAADVAAAHGGRLCTAPSSAGARIVLELPLLGQAGSAVGG
jgi:signal transduction histidine kinase